MPLPSALLNILVCPKCRGPLDYRLSPREALLCPACALVYPVQDGIPVMLIDSAGMLDGAEFPPA